MTSWSADQTPLQQETRVRSCSAAHAQKHLRLTAEEGLRKILLDHLIEEAEGHPVPQEELQKVKAAIVTVLRPFIQALSF